MKGRTIFLLLTVFVLPMTAHAQQKKINIIGTLGTATINIHKVIINLGIEMEVFHNFYAQAGFDNLFAGTSLMANARDNRISFSQTMRTQIFAMNLLGTFKLPLTRLIAVFTKAGLSYTLRFRYYYNDNYRDSFGFYENGYNSYYNYYHGTYPEAQETPMPTGLAYTLGTGIEYRLNEKVALIGGGTYESLFAQTSLSKENNERGNWVKIYVGINYRLR
jgi:hypothetical protein